MRSTESGNWHPRTWLTHMFEWQVFGSRDWGHHLTSLALHAFSTVLVFLVFQKMTGAQWRSFVVAAFFGLHPLRVESVAWVAEQKDVLSVAFGLLALWAYVSYAESGEPVTVPSPRPAPPTGGGKEVARRSSGHKNAARPDIKSQTSKLRISSTLVYILALVFFALSLMSKPMLVTGPTTTAYWHLGDYAFMEHASLGQAVQYYRELLKLDPSFTDAHFQFANALYRQGAIEEAIHEYQAALKYRPDWAKAQINLGFVLESIGRLDEAIAHLQIAVRLAPSSAEAQNNLGRALYQKGEFAESIRHLQLAAALSPEVAEIHHTLGLALEAAG